MSILLIGDACIWGGGGGGAINVFKQHFTIVPATRR